MLASVGVVPGSYREVQPVDRVAALERGDVDAISGFSVNELLELEGRGRQLVVFWPDDYGVHFYGDVIVTADDLLADDEELVRRFVAASLEGWRFAVESPREAAALAAAHMGAAYDADLQLDLLAGSIPLIRPSAAPLGSMDASKWENMVATLYERGIITVAPTAAELFTTEVLESLEREQP